MSAPMPFIVCDLDGTLIDSKQDLIDATNDVVASYGGKPLPAAHVAGMIGEGAKLLVERALAASGLDPLEPLALDRFREAYDGRLLATTRPYAGIPALLDQLAGRATLAVLTNKPLEPTHRVMEALDLSRHFRWVLGGDSPFGRKPDPAGLRYLLAEAGATPDRTMLIGDSMIDVETARRAGVPVLVALYGFGAARGELVLEPHERRAATVEHLSEDVRRWCRALSDKPPADSGTA